MKLSNVSKQFIMLVCVLVITFSYSGAVVPRRKNLRKNSPIYYIASPLFNSRPTMNGLSSYSSQVFKHHFVNSLFSSPSKQKHFSSTSKHSPFSTSSLFSSFSSSSSPTASKYKPSMGTKSTNVYKLPIKFMSNAKPIEVVKGIPTTSPSNTGIRNNEVDINSHQQQLNSSKKKHLIVKDSMKQDTKSSRKKLGQSSKLIYMPLKYISNGKVSKVKLNSLSKKMMVR